MGGDQYGRPVDMRVIVRNGKGCMDHDDLAFSPRSLVSPGHRPTENEVVADEVPLRDEHKQTSPYILPTIRNQRVVACANLKALNMEMQSIDEVKQASPKVEANSVNRPCSEASASPVIAQDSRASEKGTVNPQTSPPPTPGSPLRQSLTSPVAPDGLDDTALQEIMDFGSEFDITVEGKGGAEYQRNKLASLVVGALLLISIELIWEHVMMINWVVNFNSWQMIVAVLCYAVGALFNTGMFALALVSPACSAVHRL